MKSWPEVLEAVLLRGGSRKMLYYPVSYRIYNQTECDVPQINQVIHNYFLILVTSKMIFFFITERPKWDQYFANWKFSSTRNWSTEWGSSSFLSINYKVRHFFIPLFQWNLWLLRIFLPYTECSQEEIPTCCYIHNKVKLDKWIQNVLVIQDLVACFF